VEPKKEIKETGTLVREVLRSDIKARNCDKYLCFRVFQKILGQDENLPCTLCRDYDLYKTVKCPDCGGLGFLLPNNITVTLSDLMNLPSPETIIRTRAKIQNIEHIYLPTIELVRRRRQIKEEVYRQWAQTNF